jgi:glycosyltransferase involved in cell wall biosynthesis
VKVLHVHNVAQVPTTLVKALRALGAEADFVEDPRGADLSTYDIVHVHYAVNRRSLRGVRLAKRAGKPIVLHHHGSDVRRITPAGMRPLPPWYEAVSRWARRRAIKVLLATPDLTRFCPAGAYVPNPVDLELFRPTGGEKLDRVLICGRQFKGSKLPEFIKPERKYDIVNPGYQLRLPPNVRQLPFVPWERFPAFLNQYAEMMGSIGDLVTMARLEAMACGLRTFSNFDPSYVSFYEGQNPDKVENPRGFVQKYHDSGMVAKRLAGIYESVMRA